LELTARIKKAQQEDTMIKPVSEVLKSKPYDNFKLKAGLVYKVVQGTDLLAIPKSLEREIITEAHNAGHFAVQKTMHAIQQSYWIPHLEGKVLKILGNCMKCIIYNKKLGKKEGFLHQIDKGSKPLHTIHVDHLGLMDATSKHYKYIYAFG